MDARTPDPSPDVAGAPPQAGAGSTSGRGGPAATSSPANDTQASGSATTGPAGTDREGWTVRPATVEDAPGWVDCHLTALQQTYPQMPVAFVEDRRRRREELVAEVAEELVGAEGRGEQLLVGMARGQHGASEVVGIAHTVRGAKTWEQNLLRRDGYADPRLARGVADPGLCQLSTLYVEAGWHGSGLGAALFSAAVAEQPCYLWIMTGNPRAEAFYRRRRFVTDSVTVPSGPSWHGWPMFQMARG